MWDLHPPVQLNQVKPQHGNTFTKQTKQSLLGFKEGLGGPFYRYKKVGVRKILGNDSGCLKKVLNKMHTAHGSKKSKTK